MEAELKDRNEQRRLKALQKLDVLDTQPEAEFDALAKAAAMVCGVPVALVSLVDSDRQWFKANIGLEGLKETARDVSFCTHTIEGDGLFEIGDARIDARFAENPFVTGDPNIRFYAGAPLKLSSGEKIGSLCVIDTRTRRLSQTQRTILSHLATAAATALEARRAAANERELLAIAAETQSILHHSEDAIVTRDMTGHITRWNRAAERMFGYTAGEAVGAHFSILTGNPGPDAADSLTSGRKGERRTERTCKDGSTVPVSISVGPVVSEDGEIVGITEIIRDISEIVAVEQERAGAEKRLRQCIAATEAGTWEWNIVSGENRVNDSWAGMLGYALEELTPFGIESFTSRIHPDDKAAFEARLNQHLNGESPDFEAELRMRHKLGHWVWILTRGRVMARLEDGSPEWMFGTHQDITERKREEEELRLSKEFLDRTGAAAGVGGWDFDLREGRLRWSRETCLIHDLPPDIEPALEEAIDFYSPEARPVIEAAVQRCIETGEGWDLELQLITAKGRWIWVRAVGTGEFDENGQAIRLSGAFQDISEKVAQRTAMEEINRLFTLATENGRIGIWDANLATGKTDYSDIWCGLLGYTREEIADEVDLWQSFIHPDDLDRALKADAAHVRGEAPFFEEQFRMRHKDGRWIWILDRGQVTERDADGNPLRMIGTHIDITVQKEQEAEKLLLGERLAIAADNGGIGIWEIDLAMQEATWDPWMYRLYGVEPDTRAPLVELWNRLTHPDDIERMSNAVREAIANDSLMEEDYRIVWEDGSVHHLHTTARLVRDVNGAPHRFIGASWDVTEERELGLALAGQHELMRVTLDSIGDAVISTDDEGRVRWLNPIAEMMTGWKAEDAAGKPSDEIFNIIHEETRERALDPIRVCLELGEVVGLPEDTVLISRHGKEYAVEDSCAPIRNEGGEVLGAVLVFHDVSEQRRLAREMSYRASHDQLTGLINRSEFERQLHAVSENARKGGAEAALLFIDLDRFKIINDSCGHAVGDEMLVQVSKLMSGAIRSSDYVARLGGDEFAAIIENCSAEAAQVIAQKICDLVSDFRLLHDGKQYSIGASIGLVRIEENSPSMAAVLQAADAACYAAKEEGRNRVHVWRDHDEVIKSRAGQTSWVTRIERALEHDGFVLYAQRIVPFGQSGEKTHVELLVRMVGDQGEVIPPGAFLPAAERFNLAARIDRWVLSRALEWMRDAGAGPNSVVSVNVSGQSVGDRAFHRFALDLLDGMDATLRESLCLEITETSVISNMAEAMEFIRVLRGRGVKIALDDFGAGTSSFSYLKRFCIDFLKIDGQFTQGLLTDPVDEATIRCFVEMAKVLKIKTVAEYVSDDRIADRLKGMGVDFAQGYVYHVPEPASGVVL